MKILIQVVLCLCVLGLQGCAHCPATNSDSASIELNQRWQISDGNPTASIRPPEIPIAMKLHTGQWKPVIVPGNWYQSGYQHSGIYWYRLMFDTPQQKDADQDVTLTFNGIDYFSDVWLNDHYLGHHEGYFQKFSYPVASLLRSSGTNELLVRVNSPDEQDLLHKNLIKGIFSHHDTRPGGAWSHEGQDANSGGIWAPVSLHLSHALAMDQIQSTVLWPDHDMTSAILQLTMSYQAQRAQDASVDIRLTPLDFSGQTYSHTETVHLQPNPAATQIIAVPVKNPALWWPYGYGQQHLYQVSVTVLDGARVLDRQTFQTGFRKITAPRDSFGWQINNRRIFLRGTNYIGSPWLGAMNTESYRKDLLQIRAMNANAIRVHAHVAGPELYEQADQLGLLVWQDMPLQWGYNDSPSFAENAARQAQDMITQLSTHPSIIVWSGQNEPPFECEWMKYKFKDWNDQLNIRLAHRVADVLATDTSRIAHPWSSIKEHFWQGWYFGVEEDVLKPAWYPLITEFGAQALPQLSTLRTIIPEKDLWPATLSEKDPGWTSWMYHNFQPKNNFEMAKIKRGQSLTEFIRNSQQNQAELMQLAAESYRRQRYQPVEALFQFMFRETWPSINWGIVDYLGKPKAGYDALQKAYQPILPSIEPLTVQGRQNQPANIGLWAINDTWKHYPRVILTWDITQGKKLLSHGEKLLDLPADSGRKVTELTVKPEDPISAIIISAKLTTDTGIVLGINGYNIPIASH
jgi:beta-mannosidase